MIVNLVRGFDLLPDVLDAYDQRHPCHHEGRLLGYVYQRARGRSLFLLSGEQSTLLVENAVRHGHDVLMWDSTRLAHSLGANVLQIDGGEQRAWARLTEALEL